MDYTFEEMRRGLVRGWSELGAPRTADCWLDYNKRFFGGDLMPLPMFFLPVLPYGHAVGWTCTQHPVSHIALCQPDTGKRKSTADRDTLLHEMVHAWLDQQGKDAKHAGQAWRDEIIRLHHAITRGPGECGHRRATRAAGTAIRGR
jgi:hypothetical protein